VFLGLYEHTLDDKGRLVLPRKYRAALEPGCVVAKGHDGSIHVWPRDEFERYLEASSSLPPTRGRVRSFRRSLTSTATDQAIDRAGRISLPDRLRRYAGLDKDVVVTGADDHLELWSPEAWAEIEATDDEIFRNMDEDLDIGFGGATR
jgi:MraZ protein